MKIMDYMNHFYKFFIGNNVICLNSKMDKFTCYISGISKVLNRLQRKHKNARYNEQCFEETKSLCIFAQANARQKYVFTSLFTDNVDAEPDVNYGISDVQYAIMSKKFVLNGKVYNKEFIDKVNKCILCNESGSQEISNKAIPLDIVVDHKLEVGDVIFVFIDFYYFLDRHDNSQKDVPLKLTRYMARFVKDNETNIGSSIIHRVCTKNTKYYSRHFHLPNTTVF
jgi:hypothetical protein